jgi:hypothetical protein
MIIYHNQRTFFCRPRLVWIKAPCLRLLSLASITSLKVTPTANANALSVSMSEVPCCSIRGMDDKSFGDRGSKSIIKSLIDAIVFPDLARRWRRVVIDCSVVVSMIAIMIHDHNHVKQYGQYRCFFITIDVIVIMRHNRPRTEEIWN